MFKKRKYARTDFGIVEITPGKIIFDEILNESNNLIDLLEEGDIIKLKDTKHYQEVLYIGEEKLYLSEFIYMSGLQKYKKEIEKDIEWIITHEQIKNIKYKVGKINE